MKDDEPIMEWRGKYRSEILMVCHMDAMANFEVGAISDARMREFDKMCLVKEKKPAPKPKPAKAGKKSPPLKPVTV